MLKRKCGKNFLKVWNGKLDKKYGMFNTPHVAGAVLQTLSSLIDSLSDWSFVKISSKHLHSQTLRARDLKFWHNVYQGSTKFFLSLSHFFYLKYSVKVIKFLMYEFATKKCKVLIYLQNWYFFYTFIYSWRLHA